MFYVYVTFFNESPTKAERKALKLKAGETVTRKVRYVAKHEQDADEMAIYYRQGGAFAYVEKA